MVLGWFRRNLAINLTLILFYVLIILGVLSQIYLPYRPPFQIFLPPIVITAPTTELTVAIAEVLVAFVLTATVIVEALPFLSKNGGSTTAS